MNTPPRLETACERHEILVRAVLGLLSFDMKQLLRPVACRTSAVKINRYQACSFVCCPHGLCAYTVVRPSFIVDSDYFLEVVVRENACRLCQLISTAKKYSYQRSCSTSCNFTIFIQIMAYSCDHHHDHRPT